MAWRRSCSDRRAMRSLGSLIVIAALTGCTLIGAGGGAFHASVQNRALDGERASVGQEVLVGAIVGLMVDLAVWHVAKGFTSVE